MENRNIIIMLIIIIVALAAAIGFALMNPTLAKQPTKISITSGNEQYEDESVLTVLLADLNKTPLSKEIVNITVTDTNGKVVLDDVVKTDSKGNAKLELDLKKGKYNVNVTYSGNDNHTGNTTSQNLTIKEEVAQAQVETSNVDSGSFYSPQSGRVIYTGEVHEGPDGHTWKHLGNNQWEKID